MLKKKVGFALVLLLAPIFLRAQPLRGTTGLLHAPTAEMQQSGTFMFGGNVLALEPLHFLYTNEISHTFNYFFNITLFSWLEVGYVCTLNYAEHGSGYFPEYVWGTYSNQDRSFYVRVRPIREGQWFSWMPAIVVGLDDPMSHAQYGGGEITITDLTMSDNHFTRYYIAMTKHFQIPRIGRLGVNLSWCDIYGAGSQTVKKMVMFEHIQRPALGVNLVLDGLDDRWRFLHGLNLIAEYDARTVNVGFQYSLFNDKLNFVFELNSFKYVSAGVFCRFVLKDNH